MPSSTQVQGGKGKINTGTMLGEAACARSSRKFSGRTNFSLSLSSPHAVVGKSRDKMRYIRTLHHTWYKSLAMSSLPNLAQPRDKLMSPTGTCGPGPRVNV
jgi:hypothetical protein